MVQVVEPEKRLIQPKSSLRFPSKIGYLWKFLVTANDLAAGMPMLMGGII